MTVSVSEKSESIYIASGSISAFEILFKWYEEDEVVVYLNDVKQSSGYSVAIATGSNPSQSSDSNVAGSIVFDSNPAANTVVRIEQDISETQETDYFAFGKFSAESHEGALDKLTLLIIKFKNLISDLTTRTDQNESDIDTISSGIINIDNSINALQAAATQAASDLAALTQSVDDLETSSSEDIVALQQDVANFETSLANQNTVIQTIASIIDQNAKDKRTAVNLSGGIHDVFTSIASATNQWSGEFPASAKTLDTDLKKIQVHYNGARLLSGYSVTDRTLNLTINVSGTDQLVVDYEES